MNHWTQESAKDFAYDISMDFFTQLQVRFEESELLRKDFAEKVNISPGRVSQIFNDPPDNPQLESLVRYAQALGLKVSVVAYDDGDPSNDKGPIFSGVIAKCWEHMGKPRDLSGFVNPEVNWLESDSLNVLEAPPQKPPQPQGELNSGYFNKAAGL